MKSNLLRLCLLLLSAASISACSKSSSKKSNTELLTQASWKFESEGIDFDKNGTIDMSSGEFDDCDKDDIGKFETGGTGTYDQGASKCDPADPQTESFTWQFKNGEKEIEYDGLSFIIESLTETNLRLYAEEDPGTGTTIRFYLTFKH